MTAPRAQRGMTGLEVAIVVSLVAILLAVFLARSTALQGRIEGYTVAADLDAMRTALVVAKVRGAPLPGDGNPATLVAREAAEEQRGHFLRGDFDDRYAGTVESVHALGRGQWGFVPGDGDEPGWLAYRLRAPAHYPGETLADPAHLRTRIGGDPDPELVVRPGPPAR